MIFSSGGNIGFSQGVVKGIMGTNSGEIAFYQLSN